MPAKNKVVALWNFIKSSLKRKKSSKAKSRTAHGAVAETVIEKTEEWVVPQQIEFKPPPTTRESMLARENLADTSDPGVKRIKGTTWGVIVNHHELIICELRSKLREDEPFRKTHPMERRQAAPRRKNRTETVIAQIEPQR